MAAAAFPSEASKTSAPQEALRPAPTGRVSIVKEREDDARDSSERRDTLLRVDDPAVDVLRAAFIANRLEDERAWAVEREPVPEPR